MSDANIFVWVDLLFHVRSRLLMVPMYQTLCLNAAHLHHLLVPTLL